MAKAFTSSSCRCATTPTPAGTKRSERLAKSPCAVGRTNSTRRGNRPKAATSPSMPKTGPGKGSASARLSTSPAS